MKRVLVTPMDWGLGHAARSIPVIRELQLQGCEVLIAGSGASLEMLRKEFSSLRFFTLPGYDPVYPLNGSMVAAMVRQLPHFTRTISREHAALENIIAHEEINGIISDNRYGCWSHKVPCALLTHQSNILMPARFGLLAGVVRYISDRMISRFDECWIPDNPGNDSLAGDLAFQSRRIKTKVKFVGWLSRLKPSPVPSPTLYDVAAIFSGPEPQRTQLEHRIAPQLKGSGLRYRIVRGQPDSSSPEDEYTVNFLSSDGIRKLLDHSSLVIARSGYSTIMDLAAMGKKAVFVPTPGQTEQEYLASRLKQQGVAYFIPQSDFDVRTALEESKRYSGFTLAEENSLLADAVRNFLQQLHAP